VIEEVGDHLLNDLDHEMLRREPDENLQRYISTLEQATNQLKATLLTRTNVGTSRYSSKALLRQALEESDVKLLRGDFIISLHASAHDPRSTARFERRQDLPAVAFYHGPLESVEVVVISYAWLAVSHPDESSHHLSIIAPLVKSFQKYIGKPVAVFIDFCCLYQPPRTEAEHRAFKRGLSSMNILYAHQDTHLWIQSRMPAEATRSIHTSGWCCFEANVGALGKRHDMMLDLDLLTCEPGLVREFRGQVIEICKTRRQPPLTPERFRAELTRRIFTNGADAAVVARLYEETLAALMGTATSLHYGRLDWGDEEFQHVAEVLPWCQSLRELWCGYNQRLSDVGVARLAAVFPPSLTLLALEYTAVSLPANMQFADKRSDVENIVGFYAAASGLAPVAEGEVAPTSRAISLS